MMVSPLFLLRILNLAPGVLLVHPPFVSISICMAGLSSTENMITLAGKPFLDLIQSHALDPEPC